MGNMLTTNAKDYRVDTPERLYASLQLLKGWNAVGRELQCVQRVRTSIVAYRLSVTVDPATGRNYTKAAIVRTLGLKSQNPVRHYLTIGALVVAYGVDANDEWLKDTYAATARHQGPAFDAEKEYILAEGDFATRTVFDLDVLKALVNAAGSTRLSKEDRETRSYAQAFTSKDAKSYQTGKDATESVTESDGDTESEGTESESVVDTAAVLGQLATLMAMIDNGGDNVDRAIVNRAMLEAAAGMIRTAPAVVDSKVA